MTQTDARSTVRLYVNGEPLDVPAGTTVAQLLERLQVAPTGIALAKNDRVVRRAAFMCEPVREGDRIEIIKAVAGG